VIDEFVVRYRSVVQDKALPFKGDHDTAGFCFNRDKISEAGLKGLTGDCNYRRKGRVEMIVVVGDWAYIGRGCRRLGIHIIFSGRLT
jgi:hypothetical protein